MHFSRVAVVFALALSAAPAAFSTPVPEMPTGIAKTLPMQKQSLNGEAPYPDSSLPSAPPKANATQPASAVATGVSTGATSGALSHSSGMITWSSGALIAAGAVLSLL